MALLQRRKQGKWNLVNLVTAASLGAFLLYIVLTFTPLGGSLTASGKQSMLPSVDPQERSRLVSLVESEGHAIVFCPDDTVDHMPCEDPKINSQLSREMNFYRERHCPKHESTPLCLIPPPRGYRVPVHWPESLHKIWHDNMPYNKIADRKGHQGWMKRKGSYFLFPGGGTMFPDGAGQYIEKLKQYIPIGNGVLRTALDMGCGVASFGGYLLAENILPLSFAPRDSHKSQIQFALERGIPTFVAMLGTSRLPFPAFSFDFIHCSRCLIPFTAYNAAYFIEVDRLLRPGGYLVISGPPVKWPKQEKEWADLQEVAKSLCYEVIVINGNTVIWKKPIDDSCLPNKNQFGLKLCDPSENPSLAWYYKLKQCVTRISSIKGEYGVGAIPKWPERLKKASTRANVVENGIEVFEEDTKRWSKRIKYYKETLKLKIGTSSVRNVMDMNAFFGGFAASLISDPVWVMNVVPSNEPSTLGVIYDRGLIGVFHDWCEPFSTYPRTYDFIHVAAISSLIRDATTGENRCNMVDVMVEIDRILRPEGTVVIRDSPEEIHKIERIAHGVRWIYNIHDKEPKSDENVKEKILVATKKIWTH